MEELLLEAINHIKNISKKKATTESLLSYTNKSLAKNCNEATIQDFLCILCTKNMIDQTLKLPYENNKLVDDEILPAPLPGTPYTPNKYRCKISDIVLILRKI